MALRIKPAIPKINLLCGEQNRGWYRVETFQRNCDKRSSYLSSMHDAGMRKKENEFKPYKPKVGAK